MRSARLAEIEHRCEQARDCSLARIVVDGCHHDRPDMSRCCAECAALADAVEDRAALASAARRLADENAEAKREQDILHGLEMSNLRRAEKAEGRVQDLEAALAETRASYEACCVSLEDWRTQFSVQRKRADQAEAEVARLTGQLRITTEEAILMRTSRADELADCRQRLARQAIKVQERQDDWHRMRDTLAERDATMARLREACEHAREALTCGDEDGSHFCERCDNTVDWSHVVRDEITVALALPAPPAATEADRGTGD
jgi:hypothetical protein